MLAEIIKTNTNLLKKCLQSKSNAVYFAAVENLRKAVENFGPSLNKHLPGLLHLVR